MIAGNDRRSHTDARWLPRSPAGRARILVTSLGESKHSAPIDPGNLEAGQR